MSNALVLKHPCSLACFKVALENDSVCPKVLASGTVCGDLNSSATVVREHGCSFVVCDEVSFRLTFSVRDCCLAIVRGAVFFASCSGCFNLLATGFGDARDRVEGLDDVSCRVDGLDDARDRVEGLGVVSCRVEGLGDISFLAGMFGGITLFDIDCGGVFFLDSDWSVVVFLEVGDGGDGGDVTCLVASSGDIEFIATFWFCVTFLGCFADMIFLDAGCGDVSFLGTSCGEVTCFVSV